MVDQEAVKLYNFANPKITTKWIMNYDISEQKNLMIFIYLFIYLINLIIYVLVSLNCDKPFFFLIETSHSYKLYSLFFIL